MKEAAERHPLLDPKYFLGCLYDPDEGHVDPSGVTHAYAICARNRGASSRPGQRSIDAARPCMPRIPI